MEQKLTILKLFMDAIGIECNTNSVNDRKAMQKAIYLGQQFSGIDLGYRYGWYKLGPYCSELADDYYNLGRALRLNKSATQGKQLPPQVTQKLKSTIQFLNPPDSWTLQKEDWLEMVASYHYLRTVRRKDHSQSVDILRTEKPKLAPHVMQAVELLKLN